MGPFTESAAPSHSCGLSCPKDSASAAMCPLVADGVCLYRQSKVLFRISGLCCVRVQQDKQLLSLGVRRDACRTLCEKTRTASYAPLVSWEGLLKAYL
jgi:hypothetical protein